MRSLALFLLFLACCTPFATGGSSSTLSSSDAAPDNNDNNDNDDAGDGGLSSSSNPPPDDSEPDAGPIGVVDPSCARKLLTGKNTVTGSADNISPGAVDAYGYSVSGSVSIPIAHCLWVYIAEGAGSDILVAVYDEQVGLPPIPSNQKAQGTIKNVKIGWNAAALNVDVPVTPLKTLWLATGPSKGSIKIAINASCANNNQRPLQARTDLTPGQLPDPFQPNYSQPLCAPAMYLSPKR